jgi:hypothetical protein
MVGGAKEAEWTFRLPQGAKYGCAAKSPSVNALGA